MAVSSRLSSPSLLPHFFDWCSSRSSMGLICISIATLLRSSDANISHTLRDKSSENAYFRCLRRVASRLIRWHLPLGHSAILARSDKSFIQDVHSLDEASYRSEPVRGVVPCLFYRSVYSVCNHPDTILQEQSTAY